MVAMPEPPPWLYRVTFALVGGLIGALVVAIFKGGGAIALLDQLTSPLSFIVGAVALYLVLYDFAGRHVHAAPPARPGWGRTGAIMIVCALLGGFAFFLINAANSEKRDVFALHYDTWKEPCEDTDGPELLDDRSTERQRFLCRFRVNRTYAAEVFVTDYFVADALKAFEPVPDSQVTILERGTWAGPQKSSGTYIKYTLKAGKGYARYWLHDDDGQVVIMSSMDTTTEPDETEFKVAREALLAKRYQMRKTGGR
jgi:hypothetical protein